MEFIKTITTLKEFWNLNNCDEKRAAIDCKICPFESICSGVSDIITNNIETVTKAAETLEKWDNERPKNTRQSEILKIIPNLRMDNGITIICPTVIDTNYRCPFQINATDASIECKNCKKDYWLTEVKNSHF